MKQFLFIISFLVISSFLKSQNLFVLKDNEMYFKVMRNWSKSEADSILALYDMSQLSYDSLVNKGTLGSFANDGWQIAKRTKKYIKISKKINQNIEGSWENISFNNYWTSDSSYSGNQFTKNVYGYNQWKKQSVFEINGKTRFYLYGNGSAQGVFLSGSFNKWSTGKTEMIKTEEGWYIDLDIPAGRHEYKFIIDGYWKRDFNNLTKISDNCGDYNSVYFKPNYTFTYSNPDAKSVLLAGNFNNWDEKNTQMLKNNTGWYLPVFLPDGDYTYKFIVDGNWICDPSNPQRVPNEHNTDNSFLEIGQKTNVTFNLSGFQDAKKVILTGSFNGWNETQLVMKSSAEGWTYTIPLRAGFYTYKYIVDGRWYADSANLTFPSSVFNEVDNWIVVEPNHTFILSGYNDAKDVRITGSFIDWMEPGLEMSKVGDAWVLPFFLQNGKITYKFVVDGKWIIDPGNSQFEENEFNTGNSVIWIE